MGKARKISRFVVDTARKKFLGRYGLNDKYKAESDRDRSNTILGAHACFLVSYLLVLTRLWGG